MKTVTYIIFSILLTKTISGQVDPTSLWIFRMDQNATENFLYEKFQGNNDGFPTSAVLFSKNDTIKYQSGQIFRTCEVSENKLSGQYKIYYPSGQLYLLSIYKNNILTDSSIIYNDKGNIESIIKYISPTQEQQVYFDSNNKQKRIDNIEIVTTTNVTFKSGYVHTNTDKSVKTDYFNSDGQKIKRKKYFKLHPDEKK
jgi:antitoxin component YwqK of YwqJK toxin-antitoxin module